MNTPLIVLIAAVALAGGAVAVSRVARSRQRGEAEARGDSDFPPRPKWKPSLTVDIPRTVKTFAYYSDRKRSFAVFEHGTCVLVPAEASNIESEAKAILDKVYKYHPDFNPRTMDDGNVLISYSQPAFSVVFKDEFENNRAYIEKHHLDGVVRAEVLLNAQGEPNRFDDRGKIGLFGRARMFLDAQNPKIVQVWRPVQ